MLRRFGYVTSIVALILMVSNLLFAAEPAYPPVSGNVATIDQVGTSKAIVIQTGNTNWVYVSQQGYNFPQTGGGWKLGAYINQTGDNNIAKSVWTTTNDNNGVGIDQTGDSHKAYQYVGSYQQKTTSYSVMGLDIEQWGGNDNWAFQQTIASFGSYGIQDMLIRQQGSDNFMNQLSVGGMAGKMESFQTGNSNDYDVSGKSVAGMASPLALPWAHKPVLSLPSPGAGTPAGEYGQYQNARYGVATVNITGDSNHTAQYQEYRVWATSGAHKATGAIIGGSNYLVQGQIGESNQAYSDIAGDENIVWQSQDGDLNQSDISLTGDSNEAGTMQLGDSNIAKYLVAGDANYIIGLSTGDSNNIDVDVTGDANDINIAQTGNSNGAKVDVVGDTNDVDVIQAGNSNASTTNISGNNNAATTTQTNNFNTGVINITGNGNIGIVTQL